ncbi:MULTISPECIES: hypothetical protein [unclassified Methylobacterium]|jgi:hypothetical protein|uniref:hypothetical protein n=1 Tax=unclassified Methylobacterium TaxID=2615210 RepID=UPI0006F28D71|nr:MULTISPECIES: hypothetical protein [unclassified Methylobacterium]KQO63356.1 hypothetical protein ASF20_08155 [Methylobacterium sp. Leaf88]KQO69163.1 hypothetical protein ASF18_01590 [Methylobacterium sp. Leaf89]KQP65849.1 hypothetical protein ASF41_21965 [Methylobacterium sp. Leaf111]KQT71380.1 hypothetical protein ASG51_10580 [Methylobacterium sp. Leaf465]KQU25506.1 hypothetical protein ASG63_20575 [Methylobacterium sp. Leaf94]
MAENPSNFVRDWISEHVRSDPFFNGHVEERVGLVLKRLTSASEAADIPQDDPELAPDLLRDLIQAAIERTRDPSAGLQSF